MPFLNVDYTVWLKVLLVIVVLVGLIAGVWFVFGKLQALNKLLKIPAAPRAIVSYQFAGSRDRVNNILTGWKDKELMAEEQEILIGRRNQTATDAARESLYWDFPFLILYSTLLALLVYLVAIGVEGCPGWLFVGFLLMYGQWLAAIFDFFENIALLIMLNNNAAIVALPQLAFLLAALKFLLIILGFSYFLVGLLMVVTTRFLI